MARKMKNEHFQFGCAHTLFDATVSAGNVFTWATSSSAAHPLLFILIFPFNVRMKFIGASTKWFPIADALCVVYIVHDATDAT